MPRTYSSQINAIKISSIFVDATASLATLTYEVGCVTETPVVADGEQTGVETSFTGIPQAANGTSVTLPLSDAETLGAQKQMLVEAAMNQEGLDLAGGDVPLT